MSTKTLLWIAVALAGYAGVGVAGISEMLTLHAEEPVAEITVPDPVEGLDSTAVTAANMLFQ